MKDVVRKVEEAYTAFQGVVRKTPLFRSELFEEHIGASVPIFFKAENLQHTGAFKVRGALNKLLEILPRAKEKGVITASAGNHAQGVAYHARRLGVKAKIVMPVKTPLVKVKATKRWGAEVILTGETYQEAFAHAQECQRQEDLEYVHAFDDSSVIIGQGTLGLEIYQQCPEVEVYICPVGGGGLISGSAGYLKEKNPELKVLAVQAEGCASLPASLEAGQPVSLERAVTIAEGMAAKRIGDLTFDLCRRLVDECLLVSDEEIAEGLLWALENERLFVEGCGGAAIAAALQNPQALTGPTVILLSGGNLDVNLLARIIERGMAKTGRMVCFEAVISDAPGALERLVHILAEQKANIIQIGHDRVFGQTQLREAHVHFTVETDGPEHVKRLKNALYEQGYRPKIL